MANKNGFKLMFPRDVDGGSELKVNVKESDGLGGIIGVGNLISIVVCGHGVRVERDRGSVVSKDQLSDTI